MTSMPDAVAAPPRPAPASPQRSGSAGDDARDDDFASLVDDAAEDEPDETASRPDRLRRRKDPHADGSAAAQASAAQAAIQAAVQAGAGAEAPLMPWMTAGLPATAAAQAPAEAPGTPPPGVAAPQALVPPQAGRPSAATGAASPETPQPDSAAANPTAAPTPAPLPASRPASAPAPSAGPAQPQTDTAGSTAVEATAGPAAQGDAGQPTPAAAAQPAATMMATGLTTTDGDGRASRRAESTDPRTAGRATRGTGRPDASAKAEQPGVAPQSGKPPAAEAVPAPNTVQTAALPSADVTGALPTGTGGTPPATGFEAVPTLPAQAATHYAAAAASGRAATAHSPAMAQLAAPLVRVLEAGGGAFHIDLAPAELGRIRVVAEVSDGKVALTVQAEQADTLALLRRDMQQLERALGDAGLSLDNASLQFSLQDDGQSRGFAAPGQDGRSGGWRTAAVADSVSEPDPHGDRPMRPIDGLVDVTV